MLKEKSTLISEVPADEVYRFFNIWLGNNGIATGNNTGNGIVCFKG
jgi:PGF-pre-PGF domain-containing protein